jgi:hypothetical protein
MRCSQNDVGPDLGKASCTTCIAYGEPCTWDRAPRKRGTKPGTTTGLKKAVPWKQKILDDHEHIGSLIDVYLDTVHPVFPLYCERELWVGWRESKFPASSSEYASLIAMCALSAQHARHGSLFETDEPRGDLAAGTEPYLTDSINLVMEQQLEVLDLEFIRACGFLALFGIQTGNRSMIHKYLGMYHDICARFSLHDESHWDDGFGDMSICELETRRRLYWAMYKLEVHSACVLGHMIRMPENQSNVEYPAGLHHPAFISGRDGEFEDWFAGWNTTTDLYRILEHAIIEFRARRRRTGVNTQKAMEDVSLHQRLIEIQTRALPQFDLIHNKSADSGRNRCSFQATNILFTIHMIRMFLAGGYPPRMLEAARTLLDSVKRIPTAYIRACGVRLLQELAGTGLMLGALAAQTSTSSDQAQSLINVQIALAEFIETSTAANETAMALATRLREQMNQVNFHLISAQHADGTIDSSEQMQHAWDGDIHELVRFDQPSCHDGIINVHFRPGFLVDYTEFQNGSVEA